MTRSAQHVTVSRWLTGGVAVVLVGAVAAAGPARASGGCRVLTDPAGDVTITATGTATPDQHLDITGLTAQRRADALLLTITDTKLDERRFGDWRVDFTAGGRRLFAEAGMGAGANVGDSQYSFGGFRAGVAGGRGVAIPGAVLADRSAITMTVPWRVLGVSASSALSGFSVQAHEALANANQAPAPAVALVLADAARSSTALPATGCR